jgi:futalosine hydrolase
VILVVAATARELEFVVGAETLVCGIGPVESALATSRALAVAGLEEAALEGAALERAALERAWPTVLLHIGIAGAQTLEPPALVLGSEAVYADVLDAKAVFPRIDRVEPDPALLAIVRDLLPDAHVLPIATTGRVGGGTVCEVEAMEGFGVLRAAAQAGVPALEIRAVSNAVGEPDRTRWRIDDALAVLASSVARLIEGLHA